MKRLLLLRHAKAEPPGAGPDFERPLAERGRRAAPLIGAQIERLGLRPDRVLCSPAMRARQTLYLAATEINTAPEISFLSDLYEADTTDYIEQIRLSGRDAEVLLIVGHNPATEDAVRTLASPSADSLPWPADFPTAALAVITFQGDDWQAMRAGTGRLIDFIRPRDLE